MKRFDLCICETGCGFILAKAKPLVVVPNDEVILEDERRVAVVNVLLVEKDSETYEFIYQLSKQTTLPRVVKVVRYTEV